MSGAVKDLVSSSLTKEETLKNVALDDDHKIIDDSQSSPAEKSSRKIKQYLGYLENQGKDRKKEKKEEVKACKRKKKKKRSTKLGLLQAENVKLVRDLKFANRQNEEKKRKDEGKEAELKLLRADNSRLLSELKIARRRGEDLARCIRLQTFAGNMVLLARFRRNRKLERMMGAAVIAFAGQGKFGIIEERRMLANGVEPKQTVIPLLGDIGTGLKFVRLPIALPGEIPQIVKKEPVPVFAPANIDNLAREFSRGKRTKKAAKLKKTADDLAQAGKEKTTQRLLREMKEQIPRNVVPLTSGVFQKPVANSLKETIWRNSKYKNVPPTKWVWVRRKGKDSDWTEEEANRIAALFFEHCAGYCILPKMKAVLILKTGGIEEDKIKVRLKNETEYPVIYGATTDMPLSEITKGILLTI